MRIGSRLEMGKRADLTENEEVRKLWENIVCIAMIVQKQKR